MPTVLTTNNYHVVACGSTMTFHKMPILVDIQDIGLKVLFRFEQHSFQPGANIQTFQTDEADIGINLINFNIDGGSGTMEPIHLGSNNGKALYINMRVLASSDTADFIFYYSFYREI